MNQHRNNNSPSSFKCNYSPFPWKHSNRNLGLVYLLKQVPTTRSIHRDEHVSLSLCLRCYFPLLFLGYSFITTCASNLGKNNKVFVKSGSEYGQWDLNTVSDSAWYLKFGQARFTTNFCWIAPTTDVLRFWKQIIRSE